jgi:hypothetical protein
VQSRVLFIQKRNQTAAYWPNGRVAGTSALYLGVSGFKYQPKNTLYWQAFRGFPKPLQVNARIVLQIRPRRLSSTFILIHRSLKLSFTIICIVLKKMIPASWRRYVQMKTASTLMIEGIRSFETSAWSCKTARRHYPEGHNRHIHCRQNIQSHIIDQVAITTLAYDVVYLRVLKSRFTLESCIGLFNVTSTSISMSGVVAQGDPCTATIF